jgi:hypothetical protein
VVVAVGENANLHRRAAPGWTPKGAANLDSSNDRGTTLRLPGALCAASAPRRVADVLVIWLSLEPNSHEVFQKFDVLLANTILIFVIHGICAGAPGTGLANAEYHSRLVPAQAAKGIWSRIVWFVVL